MRSKNSYLNLHFFYMAKNQENLNIDYPFLRIKGDVNGDLVVNILDVLLFINFFFDELSFSQDQIWSADMTSDNMLDITDIVFLVNFIFVH